MEVLREHAEGLIGTSACVGGAIPRALLDGRHEKAKMLAAEYVSIFGEGNFYFELQNHGIDREIVAFDEMIKLGRSMGIPFIVTNDAALSESRRRFLARSTSVHPDADHHRRPESIPFWLRPNLFQVARRKWPCCFPICPRRLAIPLTIAERCNVEIKAKPPAAQTRLSRWFFFRGRVSCATWRKKGLRKNSRTSRPESRSGSSTNSMSFVKWDSKDIFLSCSDFVKAAAGTGRHDRMPRFGGGEPCCLRNRDHRR